MAITQRRVIAAIGTGTVAGALLIGAAPAASADPPPNCTAADLAGIVGGVSTATSAYLFTHPDVNAFFTGLNGAPRDTVRPQVRQYLDANPSVATDLQAIRQPLVDQKNRCGISITPSS
jgi:hemophore-related protein